jgi:hypothetical protein
MDIDEIDAIQVFGDLIEKMRKEHPNASIKIQMQALRALEECVGETWNPDGDFNYDSEDSELLEPHVNTIDPDDDGDDDDDMFT